MATKSFQTLDEPMADLSLERLKALDLVSDLVIYENIEPIINEQLSFATDKMELKPEFEQNYATYTIKTGEEFSEWLKKESEDTSNRQSSYSEG